MVNKLESGKVANETVVENKAKDKEGKTHTERVVTDKETGKVKSHTVDGKPVGEIPKPQQINYIGGNGEAILIHQNNQILNVLKEMNFYLAKLANEKVVNG